MTPHELRYRQSKESLNIFVQALRTRVEVVLDRAIGIVEMEYEKINEQRLLFGNGLRSEVRFRVENPAQIRSSIDFGPYLTMALGESEQALKTPRLGISAKRNGGKE